MQARLVACTGLTGTNEACVHDLLVVALERVLGPAGTCISDDQDTQATPMMRTPFFCQTCTSRFGPISMVRGAGRGPRPGGRPGSRARARAPRATLEGIYPAACTPSRPKHPAQRLALDVGSPRADLAAGRGYFFASVTGSPPHPTVPAC